MNIALIGLGMVARTHVRAIIAMQDQAKLVGVFARDRTSAAEFVTDACADVTVTPHIYNDISEIASDANVDVVVICTPPNARVEIVEELAKAGKHIIMEKPLERTMEAAQEIVETCEKYNVELGVFFQHRMRQSSIKMQQLMAEHAFGEIALVEIAVPWWREQAYYDEPGRGTYARDGGGVLISQAIHTLDLALSILGPVEKVQAMARSTSLHKMESEDYVSAGLDFASGAVGSLVASTASFPGGVESITVHGSKASAVLKAGVIDVSYQDGTKDSHGEEASSGGGADPMAFTHAWHQSIIEDFLTSVKAGKKPAVTGREALNVQALIEALIQSSNQGRAVSVQPVK